MLTQELLKQLLRKLRRASPEHWHAPMTIMAVKAGNLSGNLIKQTGNIIDENQPDLMGLSTIGLTEKHFLNTMETIRGKEIPHAPISTGVKANALCLLGNIAQKLGRTLRVDPTNGKILDDKEAEKMSSRQYESGWEAKFFTV